jgi:hypothetical protein
VQIVVLPSPISDGQTVLDSPSPTGRGQTERDRRSGEGG